MTQLIPFSPYVITPEWAPRIVSPAYDSMGSLERGEYAQSHPDNYINAMRSPDEFSTADCPTLEAIQQANADRIEQFITSGAYQQEMNPSLFIYRISIDGHQQTAVIGEVPVDEYEDNAIRKHESTQYEHEERLCHYFDVVGVSSSPICLAYLDSSEIDRTINTLVGSSPELDFTLEDGVRQELWRITDPRLISSLQEAFNDIPVTYLTDGHHRTAAMVRHRRRLQEKNPLQSGPWDNLLVALFPATQLRVLPFNRCVQDLNQLEPDDFLQALNSEFRVESLAQEGFEQEELDKGQFLMFLDSIIYRLTTLNPPESTNPVENLDVSILQNLILKPLLGINDPRSETRLDYVTGELGNQTLRQRCRSSHRLGFACRATSMEELFAIADASLVMPPKSTCFDPKARSGIFIRLS